MSTVHDLEFYENYVTPEMYGAYGDGIHDDTHAFVEAFSKMLPVHCTRTYKVTHIVEIEGIYQVQLYGGKFIIECENNSFLQISNCAKIHIEDVHAEWMYQGLESTNNNYQSFVLAINVEDVYFKNCVMKNMYTAVSV